MSQDKDKLADALRALSSGEVREEPAASGPSSRPAPASRSAARGEETTGLGERSASPARSRPDRPAAPAPRDPAPSGRGGSPAVPLPGVSASSRRRAGTRPTTLRQTLIPICLTLGVLLPALAAWLWFGLDAEHPARRMGVAAPLTLAAVGVLLLGLGVANMLAARASSPAQRGN